MCAWIKCVSLHTNTQSLLLGVNKSGIVLPWADVSRVGILVRFVRSEKLEHINGCSFIWHVFLLFRPGATSIEQYCLRRDTWRQVATMSGRRLQFGVAVLDGRLYVVGGRDGLKTLNTVECYNPHSKSWSVMPPMSTHRHGLGEPHVWIEIWHTSTFQAEKGLKRSIGRAF